MNLSLNYYVINTFLFHSAFLFSMFITIAPQHLKTIILLHTICFPTSPLVNRTCNFAGWQLGCCEFDEQEGTPTHLCIKRQIKGYAPLF